VKLVIHSEPETSSQASSTCLSEESTEQLTINDMAHPTAFAIPGQIGSLYRFFDKKNAITKMAFFMGDDIFYLRTYYFIQAFWSLPVLLLAPT
jgi:hypothetical protein